MKRFPAAMALLAVLVFTFSVASAEKIYFGDTGHDKIRRCDLNGSNIEELVTTGLSAVGSIAIDRTGGKMYWADWPEATARIQRANLDGSDVEDVLIGLNGPYGIALDIPAGKMYWTEFSAQKVRRADLDGSNIEDLVTTGLAHPSGIALDLLGGKMYWTDGTTTFSAKVQRADLDGTNVETLVTTPLVAPMEIALDLTAGKMYWADLGSDSLYRANLDGSSVEAIIASEYGTPVGVDLDLTAGKIYFSDSGAGGSKIKKANLDGTLVQDVISSGIGACYGLTLGPATPDCSDASLDGPWIARVTGAAPYDYSVYIIFDGEGTIDEIGSFNIPDSAGEYSIDPDCDVSGYIWSDGYAPFTGHVHSDTTAEMETGGLEPFPLLKVRDVGALEGCWSGYFAQDLPGTTYTVVINLDDLGSIQSSTGFTDPVSGKFFFESGYLAGHIITGAVESPREEVNIREATVVGDTVMTGTFALDCSGCPGGTFNLKRCGPTGIRNKSSGWSSVLHQSYPNPFNPQTTIAYAVRETGRVDLRIYDAAGRLVKTLVEGSKTAGEHTTTWDGRDNNGIEASSGVYFIRLKSGGDVHTRKSVFLK